MKRPQQGEEFLVWPALGVCVAMLIGATCLDVFTQYQKLITLQEGDALFAGYLFPFAMAIAFAWRLHGKYWLGFAWIGVISYFLAWLASLFEPVEGFASSALMLFTCLSILFAAQSSLLYCKRRWWQAEL